MHWLEVKLHIICFEGIGKNLNILPLEQRNINRSKAKCLDFHNIQKTTDAKLFGLYVIQHRFGLYVIQHAHGTRVNVAHGTFTEVTCFDGIFLLYVCVNRDF